ncbi:hypothetical protein N6H13_25970 [Paenibacillus sp. CC-CFT742]|nr:hypothetical protein [Paenibacillus sp. CC-CFT742]WJH28442.1 hypothetical protein N6H13_25970 [Paenibacillus sp. CC-CFT742]
MPILKKPLNYGGRLYVEGEEIQGQVPLEMIELLRETDSLEVDEQSESSDDPVLEDAAKSVSELSEYLKTVNDAEEVTALLADEKAGKARAGAIKALEARLKEIQDERV